MRQINCIIVDDDEIDRLMTISNVKKYPQFNLIGAYDNAKDALETINTEKIDVLFLDIDMPEINGFEIRKSAEKIPACIFITSHPEHAVESFEYETLDFIIKPVKNERFKSTVIRIEEFLEIKQKAALFEASIGGDAIYIKEGHEQTKVKLHDILYLEALKDYTLVVTTHKKHCVLSSIGTLLKEHHFQSFVRIHRSFAVQKQYVKKISSQEIELNNNISIPIGRSYKDNLNLIS